MSVFRQLVFRLLKTCSESKEKCSFWIEWNLKVFRRKAGCCWGKSPNLPSLISLWIGINQGSIVRTHFALSSFLATLRAVAAPNDWPETISLSRLRFTPSGNLSFSYKKFLFVISSMREIASFSLMLIFLWTSSYSNHGTEVSNFHYLLPEASSV